LQGQRREDAVQILLTASGGPFHRRAHEEFDSITPAEALRHPNWSMGAKITIDSATMMNKGLEVIEASWLFGVPQDMIRVVVHPQSIIHSMVAFKDSSVLAQLAVPDMKGAIAYALSYPERLPLGQALPAFSSDTCLTFSDPDLAKFPCLGLAYEACRIGGTMPAVLNAANEIAVNAFLQERVPFTAIALVVRGAMEAYIPGGDPDLEAILDADSWARRKANELANSVGR
jgi:1-deoxy-D-xylulose-5-phosphate reductoisomerase